MSSTPEISLTLSFYPQNRISQVKIIVMGDLRQQSLPKVTQAFSMTTGFVAAVFWQGVREVGKGSCWHFICRDTERHRSWMYILHQTASNSLNTDDPTNHSPCLRYIHHRKMLKTVKSHRSSAILFVHCNGDRTKPFETVSQYNHLLYMYMKHTNDTYGYSSL